MNAPSQADVIAFLSSGEAFGGTPPGHVETSVSHVFIGDDVVYKLKKDILLDYLDYSTARKRREMCERELKLNHLAAPALYRSVEPVNWDGQSLSVAGEGAAIDWLVRMRRFDETMTFDRLAHEGKLTLQHVAALTEEVVAFHAIAKERPDMGGAGEMHRVSQFVAATLKQHSQGILNPGQIETWDKAIDRAFARSAALLNQRQAHGFVRQCHGDMHLGNICIYDDMPTLFDCIEFSDEIACIDVLYDLAFLCMDLCFHGLEQHANLVMNRYLSATRDFSGLDAFPAFLSLRAAIRAMTSAIEMQEKSTLDPKECHDGVKHLDFAVAALQRPRPSLLAIGGLSGSGKSSLAAALATRICAGAGAVIVSSDVIRKRMFGAAPEDELDAEAYEPQVSAKTYVRLFDDCDTALGAGQTVIADATFLREEDRAKIAQVAKDWGASFKGIWLDAPGDVLKARTGARTGDPSDAGPEVVDTQLSQKLGTITWSRLDSERKTLTEDALTLLSE
ncbi:MAG: AAA family ATPase [Alphaproteobacteria bacterium]